MALSALRYVLAVRLILAISVALGFGMQRVGAKLCYSTSVAIVFAD